jgi:hypothetical protein
VKFAFTPEESEVIARAVVKHLRRHKMKVTIEVPFSDDAPYRTTLLAKQSDLSLLIEAQGMLSYHKPIQGLAGWLAARRHYAELFLATSSESLMTVATLQETKKDGVGLLLVDDEGKVTVTQSARNPALVVNPDPTLKLGNCRAEILAAVTKFNEVNRKDGLRDMCELVERETESLALLASRKRRLKPDEAAIQAQDWSTQINTLASVNALRSGSTPIFDTRMKDDMHSFRGARNLVDHQARNKRDDQKRQRQFAERMVQGPRLIAELQALARQLR